MCLAGIDLKDYYHDCKLYALHFIPTIVICQIRRNHSTTENFLRNTILKFTHFSMGQPHLISGVDTHYLLSNQQDLGVGQHIKD